MDFSWSAYQNVCESVDLGWSSLCRRVTVIPVKLLSREPTLHSAAAPQLPTPVEQGCSSKIATAEII
jgi:hypothetical protein